MWHIFSSNQIPTVDKSNLPTTVADQARIDETVAIIFGVLGTIAVLMLVWGGIKYITSQGNPGEMSKAKDTIMYAAVGIGVCILAYSIVAFVVSSI